MKKTKFSTKLYIKNPKSNVLDLSKEPTEIVLRPSMLEAPGEYEKEQVAWQS